MLNSVAEYLLDTLDAASGVIDLVAPYGVREDESVALLAAPQSITWLTANNGEMHMQVADLLFDIEYAGSLVGVMIFNSTALVADSVPKTGNGGTTYTANDIDNTHGKPAEITTAQTVTVGDVARLADLILEIGD